MIPEKTAKLSRREVLGVMGISVGLIGGIGGVTLFTIGIKDLERIPKDAKNEVSTNYLGLLGQNNETLEVAQKTVTLINEKEGKGEKLTEAEVAVLPELTALSAIKMIAARKILLETARLENQPSDLGLSRKQRDTYFTWGGLYAATLSVVTGVAGYVIFNNSLSETVRSEKASTA